MFSCNINKVKLSEKLSKKKKERIQIQKKKNNGEKSSNKPKKLLEFPTTPDPFFRIKDPLSGSLLCGENGS